MTTLISILIIIASIALILVVIVQKSKGGGLAASFSGANNIMGVRKATDGIEKATWYLISAVVVLSIAYSAFSDRAVQSSADKISEGIEQKANTQPAIPSLPALGGGEATTAPAVSTPAESPATDAAEATTATPAPTASEPAQGN